MARRTRMTRRQSRRNFRRGTRVNGRNATRRPMRGGIRI